MLALLAVAGATLSACAPTPEPSPTPTAAFASEQEAFAAAEETYRAYNDALNAVDIGDPSTHEAVFALASGDFEAADRKSFSELRAENYSMRGKTVLTKFDGIETETPFDEVVALVCLDVSDSDVIDESGRSVVSPDRPDLNAVRVTFRGSAGDLLIDHAERDENSACAD